MKTKSVYKKFICKKCGMEYSLEIEPDEKEAILRCINSNLNKKRICGGILKEVK